MKGHLRITCTTEGTGLSHLSHQSFCAPFHLSKPHEDAGALVVNVVNPTAGLFDGDEVELEAKAEHASRLVLTTPSASRIYHSRSGNPAIVRQRVDVAAGCSVEFLPEPIIPQSGSMYHQSTELNVAAGGELIFFEWLAPGRVASGEVFKYRELNWQTDVRSGETLIARERYRLDPSQPESLAALTTKFPQAHYLGCFFIAETTFPRDAIEALNNETTYLGWSPLPKAGHVIKALCADSLSTRALLGQLRTILYWALARPMPALGRF